MKKLLILLTSLISLIGCTGGSLSSGTEIGNSYVAATIANNRGNTIGGAVVKLLSHDDIPAIIDSVVTDSTGIFHFKVASNRDYNLIVSTDSSAYFMSKIALYKDSISTDTITTEPTGSLVVIIEDSINTTNREFYIAGTGISLSTSDLLFNDGRWLLTFSDLPAINEIKVLEKISSKVTDFTGKFSIIPNENRVVLGDVRWDRYSLLSTPLVGLGGIGDTLIWASDSSISKIVKGEVKETLLSSATFNFKSITSSSMGGDSTFWIANKSGGLGYILDFTTYGMVSSTPMSSSINSLAVTENGRWFFTTENGGVTTYTNKSTKVWDTMFVGINFSEVVNGSNNSVWVTTNGKLYHISDLFESTIVTAVDGLTGDSILDIAFIDDKLWVVSKSGVRTVSTSGTVETPRISGVSLIGLNSVTGNKKGVWFTSDTDLYLLQNSTLYGINWNGVSFSGYTITDCYSDGGESLWLVSEVGLYKIY